MKMFYEKDTDVNLIKDKKIAIQGAGSVGKRLAEYLASSGAQVFISDIDHSKLDEFNNKNIICVDDAFSIECDLFSPCAVGAIFTKESIYNLNCKIIAGGDYFDAGGLLASLQIESEEAES